MHPDDLPSRLRTFLHHPEAAVEQSLASIVAQADQLVAGHRQRIGKSATLAQACIVGAACGVAADQDLVGIEHALGVERVAPSPPRSRRSWPCVSGLPARISIDSRTIGSSCACRCTSVSIASGSASVKKPPPWIGGSCAGSPSTSSGTPNDIRSRAEFGIDHRAFVDHDELGLGGGRVVPQFEARRLLAAFARPVDQAVDGGRAVAALAAHHAAPPCR